MEFVYIFLIIFTITFVLKMVFLKPALLIAPLLIGAMIYFKDEMNAEIFFMGIVLILATAIAPFSSDFGRSATKRNNRPGKLKPVLKLINSPDGEHYIETDWKETFIVIEKAVKIKDYDFARKWLQKFAQESIRTEVPQEVRDKFKILMAEFAKQDPLYLEILPEILPLIENDPGIMQTAIYPKLPEYSQENIRYVLYFAQELGELTRLKKGRSYQLFGPNKITLVLPGEQIGQTIATHTIFFSKNLIDERIAALHREATTHKKFNWGAGVACLQEASDLMRRHGGNYVIDRWTRLPVFLQQAGRYEDAIKEFKRLLKEVETRVKNDAFEGTSPETIEKYIHLNYFHIYDKMRMVSKRQKDLDQAAKYAILAKKHSDLFEGLKTAP